MNLLTLSLKPEYRSLRDDIVNEFYIPALSNSVLYQRAVGFFSSTALIDVSIGLFALFRNGGRVQLVVSPRLTDDDIAAITKGYEHRSAVVERALMSEFREPTSYFETQRLNLLAHFVASHKLDIKVAFTRSHTSMGMYHEKLGLIHDSTGHTLAFTGSMNETTTAFFHNYEAMDVFCSWTQDYQRVLHKQQMFDSLWNNADPAVETIDFPNVAREKLLSYRQPDLETDVDHQQYPLPGLARSAKTSESVEPRVPPDFQLRDYQLEAIEEWRSRSFQGIFDMATGTGKTYTALAGVARLFTDASRGLAVVIVCPYQHLVEQWVEDIRLFNMKPIIGYSASSQRDWKRRLRDAVAAYNLSVLPHLTFVTTNATFATEYVQELIAKLPRESLIVIDEAHNFGAPILKSLLPEHFAYRLALSATLDRHMDPDGTAALYAYFGEKCIVYPLERAIEEGHLTPYYYHPVVVYLTDPELEDYHQLTKQLRKYTYTDDDASGRLGEATKMLLIRRSRIIASADNKLAALRSIMQDNHDQRHMLVYCGTGTVQERDETDSGEVKQIDAVIDLLGNEMNMTVSKFTAEESPVERVDIKATFADGDLQALVAIRCLDEGVDIPAIHLAFILASSTNPKEYIQRRGRVLRKAPGKSHSIIYDFVTLPRPLNEVHNYPEDDVRADIGLVRREMERLREFSSLALNQSETDRLVWQIETGYDMRLFKEDPRNG